VTLTRSKVRIKVTGLLNFRQLAKPCMLAAMTAAPLRGFLVAAVFKKFLRHGIRGVASPLELHSWQLVRFTGIFMSTMSQKLSSMSIMHRHRRTTVPANHTFMTYSEHYLSRAKHAIQAGKQRAVIDVQSCNRARYTATSFRRCAF